MLSVAADHHVIIKIMSLIMKYRLSLKLIRYYSIGLHHQQDFKGLWTRRIQRLPELSINKILNDNHYKINDIKWFKIRDELLNSKVVNLSEINVDAVILDTCNDVQKQDAALNYIKYLIDNNYKLNIAVIGKYFRLLDSLDCDLTDYEKNHVIKLYDEMRKNHLLLDATSSESCILALSKTHRWKDCIELIDMVKLTMNPKTIVGSSISAAAFDNNEETLGWKYLNDMLPRLWPTHKPYLSYLNYCKRTINNPKIFENKIMKMFQFWKDNDIHPWVKVLDQYEQSLNYNGWSGKITNIKSTGKCNNCNHNMDKLKLTPDEFECLSNIILNKVLVGDDIYHKSTPQELLKFKQFINETSPYDVVIDGLNAAYSLRNSKDNYALGNELAQVVKAFKNQDKKILVLGRHHMNKWKGPSMTYVKKNAHMFLANNLSEDDPYLLYATLKSGINTYFSSRDLMRQHKYLFNDDSESRKLFKMWQMTRQVVPKYVGTNNKNKTLLIMYPPSYVPIGQSTDTSWHLPCTSDNIYGTPPDYGNQPPKYWYCLQKKLNKFD